MRPCGVRELQHDQAAAGPQHAAHLREGAGDVADVADAERRPGRRRRPRRARAAPARRRRRGRPAPTGLRRPASRPRARACGSDMSRPTPRVPASRRSASMRRSAVPVQRSRTRAPGGAARASHRLAPPAPVDAAGEHAVEQVVARSDAVEHRPHGERLRSPWRGDVVRPSEGRGHRGHAAAAPDEPRSGGIVCQWLEKSGE